MALRSPHPDMFHAAPPPPPPPPIHHAPPPPRQQYPTTPVSDPHASPYQHQQHPSYQPRQFPTTPQTPNYASSSRSVEYPPTPHTPHYATPNSHPHGHQPHTPVQPHHTSQPRDYYPSPPVHNHAGPSRLHPPPTHPHQHYRQRYDYADSTQSPQYPSYPHSAPSRVMQGWSEQPHHPSPTSNRAGAMGGDQDVCSQFLNLNSDAQGPDDQAPPLQASAIVNPPVSTMKAVHWTPEEGRQAQELTITLEVENIPDPYDEQATRAAQRAFRGMFGKLPCSTRVTVSNTPGQSPTSRIVTLYIVAPPLHMTGCTDRSNRVPIYVQSLRAHDIEESLHIGDFTYIISTQGRVQSMPPTAEQQVYHAGTKRPGEPLEQQQEDARQWSASEAHSRFNGGDPHQQVDYGSMPPVDQNAFQYNYSPHPDQGGYMAGPPSAPLPNKHARIQQSRAPTPQPQPRAPHGRATAPPLAPSVMQPTAPMVFQPPPFGQPSLIRSTQIAGGSSWYDRLRAEIVFQNDLLSMTRGWSADEWNAKRRLVKVWRRQVDSQIFMAFRPITLEEYPESKSAVVVSCIFREDKNACYITSVDIIYLLEAVIGQRFSIEEKNRIRRNLEGFRPQTVSKSKPGSEDFFRTVMAFPEPKPRNIEKDLKVFQWDCLPGAVKKIISKYTAQYHPSGEPLVPQGVTDAHHEIQAPHPDYQAAPPAPLHPAQPHLLPPPHSQPSDDGGWSHQQGPADVNNYDPNLFTQTQGYGSSRQTHLQVDTAAANAYAGPNGNMNGNAYYPAPASASAAYSPTPQMTHSSSSNVVPNEFVVSPTATGQHDHPSGPASAPPTSVSHAHTLPHPNGGYLQQQQATAPPPYSDVHSQTYWTNQDSVHPTTTYSMGGAAYDDSGMYANLVMKPLEDESVHISAGRPPAQVGEVVDLDVRGIYTANSA